MCCTMYIPTHRHVVGGYHMTSCQNPWGHSTDTDNRHHNVLACSLADITDCTTSPVKSIGNLCDCPFAMTASIVYSLYRAGGKSFLCRCEWRIKSLLEKSTLQTNLANLPPSLDDFSMSSCLPWSRNVRKGKC